MLRSKNIPGIAPLSRRPIASTAGQTGRSPGTRAGRPERRKRDVDNLSKAIMDLLNAHQLIQDDTNVASITTSWGPTFPPAASPSPSPRRTDSPHHEKGNRHVQRRA